MRYLIRNVKLLYPVSDDYQFTLENSEEFAESVDELVEFINHELDIINSKFRVSTKENSNGQK